MAGGIDWFRWHHGSVTDPKFQLVARKSGASLPDVLAVWACLLETASQNGGRINGGGLAEIGATLELEGGIVLGIFAQLEARGLVSKTGIANPRRYFPAKQMRPSGGLWSKLRAAVFARDRYVCQYCGDSEAPLECDHVVPVADGGDHDEANLVTACRPCNRSKSSKPLEQWRAQR